MENWLVSAGKIRYCTIECMCILPCIDPCTMAAAIWKEGVKILFDDMSITKAANAAKRKRVVAMLGKIAA